MKNRAEIRAEELAAIAVRYSNDRRKQRHNPELVVDRIAKLIEKISKLSDAAAKQAKQDALADAWNAYAKAAKRL